METTETNTNFSDKVLDGRYHILRRIGDGGMADVYEAHDIVTNNTVAVKLLRKSDEASVKRFIDESKAASMLSHPNIVKIFDVSVKNDLKYIVMERVDGITLKDYMSKKSALSLEETLSYTEQILSALSHAHSRGIVHRDVKPQNILLMKNGKIKITDFGIALLPDTKQINSEEAIGTVYYISPEQARGEEVDCRTDLYSTGILMYEMATGVLPFNGDKPEEIALMHVNSVPVPPMEINPDIPYGLQQIILGAMEKSPNRRFRDAEQMRRYVTCLHNNNDFVFKTRDKNTENESDADTSENNSMKKNKKKTSKLKKLFSFKSGRKKSTGKQSRSMFPIILGVSVAFAVVFIGVGISLLDMLLKDQNNSGAADVTVPSILMEQYDPNTVEDIFDPKLYRINVEYTYNSKYPENTVMEQTPAGGANRKIPKNRRLEINLTVSKGAEMLRIPDYSITDYRTAKISAEKLGFKTEIREVASEAVEVGFVVYTEPAAKTEAPFGSKLIIYYSKGSTPDMVTVPDMMGHTPLEAYNKMNGEFKVGDVTCEHSDKYAEGLIISQSLAPKTKAIKGSYINFVISLGPENPITAPPETEPADTEPPDTDAPDVTSPQSGTETAASTEPVTAETTGSVQ